MKKYTLIDFQKQYPNDDSCLDKLYKLRFNGLICPKCDSTKEFNRVKDRRSYQCPCCGFQVYPTKGTIFEKTTTPLTYWFYAIFLQTTTRNGVAAKELERQLNICYKTALRMSHQIKILMAQKDSVKLSGIVEVDETSIIMKKSNRPSYAYGQDTVKNFKKSGKYVAKRSVSVFGFAQRQGLIYIQVVPNIKSETIIPIIKDKVEPGAHVMTDKNHSYNALKEEYKHTSVHHTNNQFVKGLTHVNTIEGFWGQLKRTIKGTHIKVSEKHLQKYIDECVFRYMYRDKQDIMFDAILQRVAL
jgi:transposase-like protein/predicted RNA-binding Zn-ribbon protein involved in translation (DUF1610 family)